MTSIIFGFLAADLLTIFGLCAAADAARAGRQKVADEAAEDAEHEAFWGPIRRENKAAA